MPFGIAAIAAPIISGIFGAASSNKAAGAQEHAAEEGIALQRQQFDQTQQNLSPWMSAGGNALQVLQQLLGIGGGGQGAGSPLLSMLGIGPGGQPGTATTPFQTSPGYQFAKQEGLGAIENAASAHGGMGGNTLKKMTNYATGAANQDYGNYFNQLRSAWNDLMGGIGGLSKTGENAAAGIGDVGANSANQITNLLGQKGNATAGGIMGGANAMAGGFNGAVQNAYQQFNSPGGLFPGLSSLFSGNGGDQFDLTGGTQFGGGPYQFGMTTSADGWV